nr:phage holin family protein [Pandoraea pnomenusa]
MWLIRRAANPRSCSTPLREVRSREYPRIPQRRAVRGHCAAPDDVPARVRHHRPWASRLAYALILATGSVPIRAIFGAPPPST